MPKAVKAACHEIFDSVAVRGLMGLRVELHGLSLPTGQFNTGSGCDPFHKEFMMEQ